MSFYNDKVSVITDSQENIHIITLKEGKILSYYFENGKIIMEERKLVDDALMEFDVCIDHKDCIHLIYQNEKYNLYLIKIQGNKIEKTLITEGPIPIIYNLNILVIDNALHIFYCILLDNKEGIYRMYHHYLEDDNWYTNIIDDIKISTVLNPINLIYDKGMIIVGYYDCIHSDEIFAKAFDVNEKKWTEKIQLTTSFSSKLYIDLLLVDRKLHLSYCEYYDGNLVVKYERFSFLDNGMIKDMEGGISNLDNCSYPTFVYFGDKIWLVWLQHEKVMSRYSLDNGENWSPVYLWQGTKNIEILRYKYLYSSKLKNIKLNFSFGKVYPDISFIGFGPLKNVVEVPLKKYQIKD